MEGKEVAQEPGYYLDGPLVRYRSSFRDVSVCSSDEAVAMAFDRETGVLMKHGKADRVQAWAAAAKAAFLAIGEKQFALDIEVAAFLPTQDALSEMNACIATTGRFPHQDLRQPDPEEEVAVPGLPGP